MTSPPLHRRSPSKRIAPRRPLAWNLLALLAILAADPALAGEGEENSAAARFREQVEPILAEHCYGCHGNGNKKGSVTLDSFANDEALLGRKDLWNAVLKNVRGGLMPPSDKPRPTAEELRTLDDWIKRGAFALDPNDPDPGRVTLRRLNRVEYRNTIRDLMGIDFRADEEFPADDTGYGFDNVGDVLSVSPLLLEKYMQAAEAIVATAVPTVARVIQVRSIAGTEFRASDGGATGERLTLYKPAKVAKVAKVAKDGSYRLVLDLASRGQFNFDPGRAKVTLRLDDKELMAEEFGWGTGKKSSVFPLDLKPGDYSLSVEIDRLR